jgi:radical SAM superfamily enzyme YgiQ (UPF0313 family)
MIPDRLPAGLREIIARFPAGCLQFEVGVQTFNPTVAVRISRRQDYERLEDNFRFLRKSTGVHVHADLIAGLPGETFASFACGFDRMIALEPQEIQVGILKRLRGTPIVRHDADLAVPHPRMHERLCVLEPRDRYRDTGPVAAILTDCHDPAALARFWSEAAGWTVCYQEDDFAGLRSPAGTGPFLEFLRNPDSKRAKNRLHPDLAPEKPDDRDAELARLLAAGATRVDVGQGEATWAVLADPEGNEFCLLTPR